MPVLKKSDKFFEIEEKQILVDGLKTNYKITGEGKDILILHGWGASSDSWLEVQKMLADKGYRVIVPDFSGFGKSITPLSPWGIKEYADFISKFIDKLNLEKIILIGHSFGGRISIRLTLLCPEKIEKLILCNSAGIKPKPGIKTSLVFVVAKIFNASLSPKYFAKIREPIRKNFYRFLRKKDYLKAEGVMKEVMKKVLKEDLKPELPGIKKETLIVWGDKDKMVPLNYAYTFKNKIKDSKLEIMQGIGHSPHLEKPTELVKIILKFINR
jgi:pimeloyl-ACP methyl ester carboxylesterase